MSDLKKDFKNYKIEKRIEISTMSSLIENLADEFNEKEKNLLISSYIVLAYAYWESCFHKFQNLVFEDFKNVPVKLLPYNLKNQVYLTLAHVSSGSNSKKIIKEVESVSIFDGIYETIHDNEESSVVEILDIFSGKLEEKNMKKHFLLDSVNPNLERVEELLKKYDLNINKILKAGVESEKIKNYFGEGLDFIVKQRNSIAHKNEKIVYDEVEYDSYDSCIDKLSENINYTPNIINHPETFIDEMTFQINGFFDLMIEEIDKKIKESLG